MLEREHTAEGTLLLARVMPDLAEHLAPYVLTPTRT